MPEDLVEGSKALIRDALDANAEERARLERALGHLGEGSRRRTPRSVKRAVVPRGQRQKQVLAVLRKGPGTASQLARRTGMAATGIYPVLTKLVSQERATKDGSVYRLASQRQG